MRASFRVRQKNKKSTSNPTRYHGTKALGRWSSSSSKSKRGISNVKRLHRILLLFLGLRNCHGWITRSPPVSMFWFQTPNRPIAARKGQALHFFGRHYRLFGSIWSVSVMKKSDHACHWGHSWLRKPCCFFQDHSNFFYEQWLWSEIVTFPCFEISSCAALITSS